MALSDWRSNLAVLVGGPRWRCRLRRRGFEPRSISTLRCEDRQVTDRVRRSPAVGALWLALSGWRSLRAAELGGVSWLNNLADLIGGPRWRCRPVAVRVRAATDRHASMRRSVDARWSEVVTGGWNSLTGGGTWRCQLADHVGVVACGCAALSRDRSARFDARIGRLPIA